MPLSEGRAIKLTTSRYFTPSGRSIHESGIEPDIELQASGDDAVDASRWLEEAATMLRDDYQLRKALAHLKTGNKDEAVSRLEELLNLSDISFKQKEARQLLEKLK